MSVRVLEESFNLKCVEAKEKKRKIKRITMIIKWYHFGHNDDNKQTKYWLIKII